VAVSLDHLPAFPSALALELEEIRAGHAHEVRGPGVAEDVRREGAEAAAVAQAGEELRKPWEQRTPSRFLADLNIPTKKIEDLVPPAPKRVGTSRAVSE
jgi:hypothetical protein